MKLTHCEPDEISHIIIKLRNLSLLRVPIFIPSPRYAFFSHILIPIDLITPGKPFPCKRILKFLSRTLTFPPLDDFFFRNEGHNSVECRNRSLHSHYSPLTNRYMFRWLDSLFSSVFVIKFEWSFSHGRARFFSLTWKEDYSIS